MRPCARRTSALICSLHCSYGHGNTDAEQLQVGTPHYRQIFGLKTRSFTTDRSLRRRHRGRWAARYRAGMADTPAADPADEPVHRALGLTDDELESIRD